MSGNFVIDWHTPTWSDFEKLFFAAHYNNLVINDLNPINTILYASQNQTQIAFCADYLLRRYIRDGSLFYCKPLLCPQKLFQKMATKKHELLTTCAQDTFFDRIDGIDRATSTIGTASNMSKNNTSGATSIANMADAIDTTSTTSKSGENGANGTTSIASNAGKNGTTGTANMTDTTSTTSKSCENDTMDTIGIANMADATYTTGTTYTAGTTSIIGTASNAGKDGTTITIGTASSKERQNFASGGVGGCKVDDALAIYEKFGVRVERFGLLSGEDLHGLGDEWERAFFRADSDYIYITQSIATLSGKRYQKKRGHINRFEKLHRDWKSCKIDKTNAIDILKVADEWLLEQGDASDTLLAERAKIKELLGHFGELPLFGVVIYSPEPCAFSIASPTSLKAVDIHFEKATKKAADDGVYALLFRQAAKTFAQYKCVNREEDLGLPGLRKSKLSWQPDLLQDKWRAVKKF